MFSPKRMRWYLVAGLTAGNFIVVTLSAYFLSGSLQERIQQTENLTQNLAQGVDQNISNSVAKIDLTLAAIADELQRQLTRGPLDAKTVDALLTRHQLRLPEVDGIRVSDAEGLVRHGPGLDPKAPANLGDRNYFAALRNDPHLGLQVSDPIFGRLVKKWIVTFARRYNHPDGRFAGIISAPIPVEHFNSLFQRYDIGASGIIALRKADLALIARYPNNVSGPAREPGNKLVSAELAALARSGVISATYHSRAPADGIPRITTFRRLQSAPMTVTVGVAEETYLQVWRKGAYQTAALVTGFILLSALSAWLLLRVLDRLHAESSQNRLYLQSASDGIHVLDEQGSVVEASDEFCAMLGYTRAEVIGMNVTQWDAQWDPVVLLKEIIPRHLWLETSATFETRHRRKNGEVFEVEISATSFALGGRRYIYASSRDISEKKRQEQILKQSEARLRASEMRLRAIIETEPECVKVVSPDGLLLQMNKAGLAMIEADDIEQVRGRKLSDIIMPGYRRAFAAMSERINRGENGELEFEIVGLKGGHRWLETHAAPLRDADGRIIAQLGVTRDITQRKRTEGQLRLAAEVFRATREGIVVTDLSGVIQAINPAFTQITGYTEEEALGQRNSILKSQRHDRDFYQNLWHSLVELGQWQGEMWNRRKNGEIYPQLLSINTVYGDMEEPLNYVGVFTDISRIKASETELKHLAHHDALTGLPNRMLLLSRLDHALSIAQRSGKHGAILFIDLDRFKDVNDSLGHPAGDELLQLVTQRFKARLRDSDTLARLGGDEFVVLIEEINAPEDAAAVATDLIEQLRAPFQLSGDHTVYLGCSIGIALYPEDAADTHSLIQYADTALYQSKNRGRGTFHFYTESMGALATQRMAMESALRRALEDGELLLHYQPLMALEGGQAVGAEALVRWQPPQGEMVPPDRFIPLAEDTGLIVPLGNWVLRTACIQASAWRAAGIPLQTIAVNVSPRQLSQGQFPAEVAAALAESGLPPEVLELELTEGALMEQGAEAEARLEALKALGVRLAIDDFGTGYSSLAYLKRLPIDKLKIDRSFVRDVPQDSADMEIVATIIAMAKNLHLQVLAEGIESEVQLQFLRTRACDLGQGYLFSKPLAPADFLHWWQENGS